MTEIELYDSGEYKKFFSKFIREKDLNKLHGLLVGICIDGKVNIEEIHQLRQWINEHKTAFSIKPFDLIYSHLLEILQDNQVDEEEIQDLLWLTNRISTWTEADLLVREGLRSLHGIFQGILADHELNELELKSLLHWLDDNDFLKGSYPYDEIETLLINVHSKGKMELQDRKLIIAFMEQFIEDNHLPVLSKEQCLELKKKFSIGAICSTNPVIEFENHNFCFTGESVRASRAEIAEIIRNAGGQFQNNVLKNTNYLIVGAKGNECWAFASYGRKVEKALQYRKKGQGIQIIHEKDFWDSL